MNGATAEALLERGLRVLSVQRTIAVVGASANPEKYGYELVDVLRKRHHVLPVNPRYEAIDELRSFPSLDALPGPPDVVVLAVRPDLAERLAATLPWPRAVVWFPPGCFTERATTAAEATGAEVIAGICPILVTRHIEARGVVS